MMALPPPQLISSPEWPPRRPLTFSRYSLGRLLRIGQKPCRKVISPLPALPTVSKSQSSESQLIRYLASASASGASFSAPVMPHSSSTVITARNGPWLSKCFMMYTIIAMPMPSSAPRLVPSACRRLPSRTSLISSVRGLKSTPSAATQTMSMCACSTVNGFSWQSSVASISAMILFTSSCTTRQPISENNLYR